MRISLSVEISRADKSRSPYFYIPVEVPAGTTRIDVGMRYRKAPDCVIDLGLFDTGFTPFPAHNGFRGWSGGARDDVFVATDGATPGYLPGPIDAGVWRIVLGLYRLPAASVSVDLTVSYDSSPRETMPPPSPPQVSRRGAGWYKGDLQCHTFHSDAQGSPEQLHETARRLGLDFLAVTDHNTISQWRNFDRISSADLVFVRGTEVTTEFGHANVFGASDWVDFRLERPEDAQLMAARAHELGGLVSLNHDKPTIPWQWPVPEIDCYEVWQSAWPALNAISLAKYQELLLEGRHVTAIGGSDYHQPDRIEPDHPLGLGRPTTVLWLPELSSTAILQALRCGNAYVTESPAGPHLEINASGQPMGSLIALPSSLTCVVGGAAGDRLSLLDANGVLRELEIADDRTELEVPVTDAEGFVRAEIIAVASRDRILSETLPHLDEIAADSSAMRIAQGPVRRALSNPIYFAGR